MNRISSETVLCRPFQATRQHRIQTSGEVQINSCKRKLWVGRSPVYILLPLGHSWLLSFAVTFKFLSAFLLCHMFSSWSPFLFITCVCFFLSSERRHNMQNLASCFPFLLPAASLQNNCCLQSIHKEWQIYRNFTESALKI